MNDELFSDAALREATRLVRQSMLDALPSPSKCPADFSPAFQKRITILFTRQRRKAMARRIVQRAAAFLLSALIGLSAWLTVDVEAREALFGWFREVYENSLIYRSSNTSSTNSSHTRYGLTEIPEGYTNFMYEENTHGGHALYRNEKGQYLRFHYMFHTDNSAFLVDKHMSDHFSVSVNGCPADLLLSTEPQTANTIIWTTEDGTAFCISAFMSEKELISLAECVEPTK